MTDDSRTLDMPNLKEGPRRVLLVVDGRSTREIPLPAVGALVLGRGAECDVQIDLPGLSRKHAQLTVGPQCTLEDLGSKNGTWVRGEKVTPHLPVRLSLGEAFRIGDVHCLAHVAGEGPVTVHTPLAASEQPVLDSPAAKEASKRLAQVARGNISVLLIAETGAGKEVFARLLHAQSPRAAGPLVSLNCAAFSETLLESELFGHEKGAFTGATSAKVGLLESASGGTVFLDEVGELSTALQAKLLRVLEERTVLAVGALKPRAIDVRFVAATNRDLKAQVAAGKFREDLYFRLNGITLAIPPLRERKEDLEPLARRFVQRAARDLGLTRAPAFSAKALAALQSHAWPGNVRELRNVVDRAVLLCGDGPIEPEHLSLELPASTKPAARPFGEEDGEVTLPDAVKQLERDRVIAALEECSGNQTRAAQLLGISRRALIIRLEQFDLPRPRRAKKT
jgi:two-component system, NtrC family, response regulator AtoC